MREHSRLFEAIIQIGKEEPALARAAVSGVPDPWIGKMNLVLLALHRLGKERAWEILEALDAKLRRRADDGCPEADDIQI